MLISLHELVAKYRVRITGVLHVGAHECEEICDYERYVGRDKILWVEALEEKVQQAKARHPGLLIEQAVASDSAGTVMFNRANNGESSSMLALGVHKVHHPQVRYVESRQLKTETLHAILSKYDIPVNFINLDIQGAELLALKGLGPHLNHIEYAYLEVNSDYVYENCALVEDIDDFLLQFGLRRVVTEWTPYKWGDAFYIKGGLGG